MRPQIHTAFLLLALLSGHAEARAAVQADPADPEARAPRRVEGHGLLAGLMRHEVYFDERADELWAVADTYKAGFDREGAMYVPFFGSDAPRDLPVRLHVAAVHMGADEIAFDRGAAPVREGTSITFERGAFVERYDLGLEGMEQSFLVRERVGSGSLRIELAVESELAGAADGADLVFRGERGHVRYSGAVAIDARGERVAAPTRLIDGRIEIEVPAAELERLRFPLLVDPVISTFNIVPPIILNGFSPDVAWDDTTEWWCGVFVRIFSGTDHDVFSLRLDAAGNEIWDSVIDTSIVSWENPKIAVNRAASQTLVVASTGAVGSRLIQGRTQAAFVLSQSGVITISPAGADNILPDVGGDGSLDATSYYCVVWQRVFNPSNSDVMRQMVRTDATLFGFTSMLASPSSTGEGGPSISKSNGTASTFERHWTVAWHRFTITDSDLYAARLQFDGAVVNSVFPLDTTVTNTRFPSVSSPTDPERHVLVAYMRGSVGNTDTGLLLLRDGTILTGGNLTTLTGSPTDENHIYPSVDSDGRDFVVVETQSIPASSMYGPFATTLTWIFDRLVVAEGHVPLGVTGLSAPLPQAACAGAAGGPQRRSMFIYHFEGFGPDPSLIGTLYDAGSYTDFCEPGRNGVMACPCGNAPSGPGRGCDNSSSTGGARLAASGSPSPDTVTLTASGMKPNAVCLLAQSSVYNIPYAFGDGVLCLTGPVLRMGAKAASAGQASWPGPAEPSISARSAVLGDTILPGSARFYFVYYRDPDGGFACIPTYNATQSLQIRW